MKTESFFNGGKILLALFGLLMLGVVGQVKAQTVQSVHDFTFVTGTAIGNNVGLPNMATDTGGTVFTVQSFTIFSLGVGETDFSALENAGIAFNSVTGTFSGTPTAAVDVTYSMVADGEVSGGVVTRSGLFSMRVKVTGDAVVGANEYFTFTSGTAIGNDVGLPSKAIGNDGGFTVASYVIFSGPETDFTALSSVGVVFNSVTGTFSGTPTAAVDITYPLIAQGPTANDRKLFDLHVFVISTSVGIAQQADIDLTAGFARTVALDEAFGGTTPYTYALTRPAGSVLPPTSILRLDSTNAMLTVGALIDSSHAGNYILSVRDADGDPASTTFAITVAPQLQLANPGNITFAIGEPHQAFSLGLATGGATPIDYKLENGGVALTADGEIASGITLTYKAASGGAAAMIEGEIVSGSGSNTSLAFIATDANGASITFAFNVYVLSKPYFAPIGDLHATAGFAKTLHTFAIASGGATGAKTYTLHRQSGVFDTTSVVFDTATRILTLATTVDTTDTALYILRAEDSLSMVGEVTFMLNIAPQLRFANETPDTAVLTTQSSTTVIYAAEGGRTPVVYELTDSTGSALANGDAYLGLAYTAPAGSTNGKFEGTATMLGEETFTITARDDNGEFASYEFILNIVDQPTFPADIAVTYTQNHAIFNTGNAASTAGDALTLPKAMGGVNPVYAVVVNNLPSGLTAETPLASGEQVISGTPAAAGMFTFSRTATDSVGGATFTVTMIVAAAPSITSSVAELHYDAAETRTDNPFTATGGAGALVYSLTEDDGTTVPSVGDLTFNTATGEIGSSAGIHTPTDGDYIMTVTDINGATASVTFAIDVEVAVDLPAVASVSFTVGTAGVVTMTAATYGFTPLSYSLGDGADSVPAYLSVINASVGTNDIIGILRYTGATTSDTSLALSFIVHDQKSPTANTDRQGFTVSMLPPPAFDTAEITALTAGYTFRAGVDITANNVLPTSPTAGATPFTYKLTTGAAYSSADFTATDIAFDAATRTLSGTFLAAASHRLHYHVRDKNGAVGSQAVTITVPGVLSLPDVADQNVGIGQTGVNIPLPAASNAVGTVGYAVTGNLPAGVTFDAATLTLGGNVTTMSAVAAEAITYTATDAFDSETAQIVFSITVTTGPAFTPNAFAATYSVGAISYTNSGTLAAGLTISAATGGSGAAGETPHRYEGATPSGITATEQADDSVIISATAPTASGEFTYTRIASDNLGRHGTYTLTILVVDAATFSGDQGDLSFTIGHTPAEETTLPSADGGYGALVLTLTPDLPTGMGLTTYNASPLTMGISGTPTAAATVGIENYTLTVTDANGAITTDTFTIRVAEMIDLGAMIDDPLTFTLGDVTQPFPPASQGQEPFVYALDGLVAATGLTFDPVARTIAAATLSITESQLQQMLTYSITDANGAGTFEAFTLDIIPIRFQADAREALFTDSATTYDLTAQLQVAAGGVTIDYGITPELSDPGLAFYLEPNDDGELIPVLESDGTYGIEQDITVPVYTFTATFGSSSVVVTQLINIQIAQTKQIATINTQLVSKVAAASVAGTMGAITDRLAAASSVAPQFSIGGQSPLVALAQNVKAIADDTFDKNQLLANSKFILPFSAGGGAISNGAIWGSAHYRRLNGEAEAVALDNAPQIDWEGDVSGLHLGVDFEVADNILVGAAVSQSNAEMNYETLDAGGKVEKGDYEITLSGLHPYINWRFGETNLWASLGYGEGDVTITPENQTQVKAVSDVNLVALGVGVSDEINPRLQLRLEARAAEIDIEGNDERTILQQDLDTNTARVLVKWHDANTRLDNRAAFVEIGLRHDDGDGDTGAAMETALGWNYLGDRTTLEAGAHGLFGRKNYNEWGAYGNFRVSGGVDGQGFALRIRPSYGEEAGEFGRVWNAESFDDIDAGDADNVDANYAWRTESRLSYGIQSAGGLVVPFFDAVTANSASDDIYRLGVDWSPHRYFDLNLTGERRLNNDDADEQRIFVQGAVKF